MEVLSLEKDELVLWAGWGVPLREDICLLTQWGHKKITRHKGTGAQLIEDQPTCK